MKVAPSTPTNWPSIWAVLNTFKHNIPSMYGIFTCIHLICKVNLRKYTNPMNPMGIGNHNFSGIEWMLANPFPAALLHEVFHELWANVVVRIQDTGPLDKNNNTQIQGGCYGFQKLAGISCSCFCRYCFRDHVFVAFMGFLGRSSTGGECSTILLQVVLLLFEEIRLTSWYGFKYYIFTKFHTCLVVSRISSINRMILVPTAHSLSVFRAPPSCWFCESLHHKQLKKIC